MKRIEVSAEVLEIMIYILENRAVDITDWIVRGGEANRATALELALIEEGLEALDLAKET
jgi:hypothetical protein